MSWQRQRCSKNPKTPKNPTNSPSCSTRPGAGQARQQQCEMDEHWHGMCSQALSSCLQASPTDDPSLKAPLLDTKDGGAGGEGGEGGGSCCGGGCQCSEFCVCKGPAAAIAAQAEMGHQMALDIDPVPYGVPHNREHAVLAPVVAESACCGGKCDCPGTCKCLGGSSPPIAGYGAGGGCACAGGCTGACACSAGGADGGCCGGVGPETLASAGSGSLPQHSCSAPCARGVKCDRGSDMMAGWRIIRDSPWYRKLTIIWIIVAMTWEGAQVGKTWDGRGIDCRPGFTV